MAKKENNQKILEFERPYYQFVPKEGNPAECVVRKLLSKPSKPQISAVERSPCIELFILVLAQMEAMMPLFKKSNEELATKTVEETEKIDNNIEMYEDSSSDSENE